MANNSFIRNYYPLLIVVVGFIFILILEFFVFKFGMEKGLSGESLSYSALCKDFPKIENEVSCEDGVRLALEKYPGKVVSVTHNFTREFASLTGEPKKIKWNGWLVRVNLTNSIETENISYYAIDVIVDSEGYAISQYVGVVK